MSTEHLSYAQGRTRSCLIQELQFSPRGGQNCIFKQSWSFQDHFPPAHSLTSSSVAFSIHRRCQRIRLHQFIIFFAFFHFIIAVAPVAGAFTSLIRRVGFEVTAPDRALDRNAGSAMCHECADLIPHIKKGRRTLHLSDLAKDESPILPRSSIWMTPPPSTCCVIPGKILAGGIDVAM